MRFEIVFTLATLVGPGLVGSGLTSVAAVAAAAAIGKAIFVGLFFIISNESRTSFRNTNEVIGQARQKQQQQQQQEL